MARRIKLVIAYDGTDFHGWQTQPGLRTVQAELDAALQRVARQPVTTAGASRTDSGVHAARQVVHVDLEANLPVENLRRALAHRVPDDMTIVHACEVPPAFHASRSACGKLYRYTLHNPEPPHAPAASRAQRYRWYVWHTLDLERMQAAANLFVGTHDFVGFANAGSQRATTVRTVQCVQVRRRCEQVHIDVAGTGFLYNQVRIMVGTLIEIGRGHWPVERVTEVLRTTDRALAGPTAPPEGLCLQWVKYEPWWSVGDEA